MLNPDARSLYTGAVTPPVGYVLDQALATTYSLDPAALLTLPVHLALAERTAAAAADPLMLLESLRRLAGRFSIYVDQAGIKPPSSGDNVLYGLLESMVIPVKALRGGVFHPKLWLLRFIQPGIQEPPLLRLIVLSRNLTYDRSWDISLQLEGKPTGKNRAVNRPLAEFLEALPTLAIQPLSESKSPQAAQLAEETRRTDWELPEGFEEIGFHVLGMDGKSWSPPWSQRMAVISPFLSPEALAWLRNQTGELAAVISRPETLNCLSSEVFSEVGKWYALDEASETEDGEAAEHSDILGLHAKVYVAEKGWWTTLYLGSANATNAALIRRANVEFLAELKGRSSRVGGIDKLLTDGGMGPILAEYAGPQEMPAADSAEILALQALEQARDWLAGAGLKVYCRPEGDAWRLSLHVDANPALDGISCFKAWPITVPEDRAVNAMEGMDSGSVDLGLYATASVTGLVAFEFTAAAKSVSLRMVLNLTVEGFPENRDDAVFESVLKNRDGFLRYLLLLLGESAGPIADIGRAGGESSGPGAWADGAAGLPILEELARAFSRDPEKLRDVQTVLARLGRSQKPDDILPPLFMELWRVFEEAMGDRNP